MSRIFQIILSSICLCSALVAQTDRQEAFPKVDVAADSYNSGDNNLISSRKSIRFETLPSEKSAQQRAAASGPSIDTVWWTQRVEKPVRTDAATRKYSLEELILMAVQYSAQVQVDAELPLIREAAVIEADSEFDWIAYLETNWRDASDPVGSSLTVGGTGNRFRDHQWTGESGLRRKNRAGGQLSIGQELGHQNNNSTFFQPNNQGSSRLTLSYSQPLLRNSGQVYNESLTMLAQIDAGIAREEYVRKLQDHLLELARAYWGLRLERIAFLQKQRLYSATEEIVKKIESRQGVDSFKSQLIRAQSALASREADLIRASQAVRNAESRIRSLVNAPEFDNYDSIEIIPADLPTSQRVQFAESDSVETALQNRPEVLQAVEQIRAASVRLQMSQNEVLPVLNLLMESYVAGLQGGSEVGQAWANQFSVGEPGYSIGVQYEIPLQNRLANSRLTRRQHELRQLQSQMRVTTEKIKLEVVVAAREVDTSFREMKAKQLAMIAAVKNRDYIQQRWELLAGEDQSSILAFDDLLRSQKQVADAEFEFTKSQMTYNLALVNIKRATGQLLAIEPVR